MNDLYTDLTYLSGLGSMPPAETDQAKADISDAETRLREHLNATAAWPEQKRSMAAELRVLETQVSWLAEKLEE